MWMGYMSELLALPPRPSQPVSPSVAAKAMPKSSGMHPKLVKADFHGSIMTGQNDTLFLPKTYPIFNSRSKQKSMSYWAFWNRDT